MEGYLRLAFQHASSRSCLLAAVTQVWSVASASAHESQIKRTLSGSMVASVIRADASSVHPVSSVNTCHRFGYGSRGGNSIPCAEVTLALASGRVEWQVPVLVPTKPYPNPPTLGGVGAPPTSPVGSARGVDPGPEKPWTATFVHRRGGKRTLCPRSASPEAIFPRKNQ